MEDLRLNELISQNDILARVRWMGQELTKTLGASSPLVVGVLKGSFVFYADLIREIDLDVTCDFCAVQSYGGFSSTGEARLTMDVSQSVYDRDVVLVEDIVDTGVTMQFLQKHFLARSPRSLTTATLLLKPDVLKVKVNLDYVGFKIASDFVVGYGLDYLGYYRNLPYIAQVNSIN